MEFECHQTLRKNLLEVELIAEAAESALSSSEPSRRTQGNAMTRAGLVLLCGYFEGFIRDIVEEYVDYVNEEKLSLDVLPDQTFCTVVENWTENFRSEQNIKVSEFKAVVRDGVNRPLNKKLFSKTGGNPTVDTIESLFKSLGVPDVIDRLSILHFGVDSTFVKESQVNANMRQKIQSVVAMHAPNNSSEVIDGVIQCIEEQWLPKKKRRKVGYVIQIEELLKKRNRIAHGEGYEQITPEELRQFVGHIRNLADGVQLQIDSVFSTIGVGNVTSALGDSENVPVAAAEGQEG